MSLAQQFLQEGSLRHQAGQLDQARVFYERVIGLEPQCFEALSRLGAIHLQCGQLEHAKQYLQKSLLIEPDQLDALSNLSYCFWKLKEFNGAAETAKKALEISEDDESTLINLGNALRGLGDIAGAKTCFSRVLSLNHHSLLGFLNLGDLSYGQKDYENSRKFFSEVLRLDPINNYAIKFYVLSLLKIGAHSDADRACEDYAKQNPQVYFLLKGLVEVEKNQDVDKAVNFLKKSLEINPLDPEALSNLGVCFAKKNALKQSLEFFNRSLRIDPANGRTLHDIALILARLKQFKQSIDALQTAQKLLPQDPSINASLGLIYSDRKEFILASQEFFKAVSLEPDNPEYIGLKIYNDLQMASWQTFRVDRQRLKETLLDNKRRYSASPFPTLAILDDPKLCASSALYFVNKNLPDQRDSYTRNAPRNAKRCAVAFVSADYRSHPVAQLLVEVIEKLDRKRFCVIGLSLIDSTAQDELSVRIRNAFDKFIEVETLADEDVVKLCRDEGIDIAVDLMGHTKDSRLGLFSKGLAPTQLTWLGYPGTTGTNFFDGVVVDPYVAPKGNECFFTEPLIYLKNCYQPNTSLETSSSNISREEAELPPNGFVFCCFNNAYKINPDVFDCWVEILKQTSDSLLWLLSASPQWDENIMRYFKEADIDPGRVVLAKRLPLKQHLARLKHADLFLDTFPYNAHTTASDALRSSVPVLTREGRSFQGRVAGSLLTCLGLPELITESPQAYIGKAVQLASRASETATLKEKLSRKLRESPLFTPTSTAKELESIFIGFLNKP